MADEELVTLFKEQVSEQLVKLGHDESKATDLHGGVRSDLVKLLTDEGFLNAQYHSKLVNGEN